METLLEFIRNTSGLSFLIMMIFLFFGLYINQVSGKGDYKYFIVILVVGLIVSFKMFSAGDEIEDRFHLHALELLAWPISLSMIFFMRNIRITRQALDIITYLVIFFQCINITRSSLLSTLIPQYALMFTFSASFVGFYGLWLLYNNLFKSKAIVITSIAIFCTAISLTKWLIPLVPLYIGLVAYYYLKSRSFTWNVLVFVPLFVVSSLALYTSRDVIAQKSGFSSFEKYYVQRVTKSEHKQEVIEGRELNSSVGGVGDGARLFVWTYHIDEWLDGNLLTGVSLNFSNPFHIPEHNIFVGYITRLGFLSIIYFLILYSYLKFSLISIKRIKVVYVGLCLFLLLLFSAGGLYGVPIACIIISSMIGLFQNKLSLIV